MLFKLSKANMFKNIIAAGLVALLITLPSFGQNFSYETFLDAQMDKVGVYMFYNISTPNVVPLKEASGEKYRFLFYIEFVISEKNHIIKDTTLVTDLSLDYYDAFFSYSFITYLDEGSYILDVLVDDFGSGKVLKERYDLKIISPVQRYSKAFIGTSVIPGVKFNNYETVITDHFLGLKDDSLIVYITFYYYPDKISFGVFKITLFNNNTLVITDTIKVLGNRTIRYSVNLKQLQYGDITLVLESDEYIRHINFEYVLSLNKTIRIVEALKYVLNKKTWNKYFKNYTKGTVVKKFVIFVDEYIDGDFERQNQLREFLRRFELAERLFIEGTRKGYQTDRGWVFILYGEPDFVEFYSSLENHIKKDLYVWYYYREGITLIFERVGVGEEWRLVSLLPTIPSSRKLEF